MHAPPGPRASTSAGAPFFSHRSHQSSALVRSSQDNAQLSELDYGWRHDIGDGSMDMDATEMLMHEDSAVELGSNSLSTTTEGRTIRSMSMVSDTQRSQGSYTQLSKRSAAALRV